MRLVMANSGHQTVPKKRYDAVVRRFVYDLRGPPGLDDEAVPGRDPMTGELLHHARRKLLRYTVDDAHLSQPPESVPEQTPAIYETPNVPPARRGSWVGFVGGDLQLE